QHQNSQNDSIVTSIPDMSEVGLKFDAYITFFRTAAKLCLEATKPTGYTIFLQTDRKHNGWLDKSYLIQDEAHKLGVRLLWHKIALRTAVGKTDLYRPTYSHMLCFSKTGSIGTPFPDVLERGTVTYANGFGILAVKAVIEYLHKRGIRRVTDPFVGSGTTLAIAELFGIDSIGVDIDPEQCKKARVLKLQHNSMTEKT
ncbi:MAG: SAM-dependent methyltransferase, partial [Chitinophagia bacterium]|nr:SAM-dependent methyltransferase [Chitinophagia bacterium]